MRKVESTAIFQRLVHGEVRTKICKVAVWRIRASACYLSAIFPSSWFGSMISVPSKGFSSRRSWSPVTKKFACNALMRPSKKLSFTSLQMFGYSRTSYCVPKMSMSLKSSLTSCSPKYFRNFFLVVTSLNSIKSCSESTSSILRVERSSFRPPSWKPMR